MSLTNRTSKLEEAVLPVRPRPSRRNGPDRSSTGCPQGLDRSPGGSIGILRKTRGRRPRRPHRTSQERVLGTHHRPDAPAPGRPSRRQARADGARLGWVALLSFFLYTFPFPVGSLPTWSDSWGPRLGDPDLPTLVSAPLGWWDASIGWVTTGTYDLWRRLVLWTGERVFDLEIVVQPTGSGDTLSYADMSLASYRMREGAARPELYGVWDVASFERDGVELPPLTTDAVRWNLLLHDHAGYDGTNHVTLQRRNGERSTFRFTEEEQLEAAEDDLRVFAFRPPARSSGTDEPVATFTLELPEKARLVLRGRFEDAGLRIELTRRLPEDFLLLNRGCRWINELPYNR